MKKNAPILVAGAGLAGLSTAYHLGEVPYLLVEREPEVGGLCRSIRRGGFTFDFTGHLLHLKRPEVEDLVLRLLGEEAFLRVDRRSGIYSHGVFTDYPFQVNTHGLPLPVVRECVMGFAATLQRREAATPNGSFRDWALATFGDGICRHFLFPYNEKLFRTDLGTISADWVAWAIPKPSWQDVVRGALGTNRKIFGYNARFLYPAAGGIDRLPRAFLPHIRPPLLSTPLVSLNVARREAFLGTGERLRYRALVSTLPLPQLLGALEDAPAWITQAARELRWVSILNLNLGFDRPCPRPEHWIYFPEPEFPFYRVGIYSNLCPASTPPGCSGFYVEISHRPDERPELRSLLVETRAALERCGLVDPGAALREVAVVAVPFAYVIHDRGRQEHLPPISRFLESNGIFSVGRYGAWEYSAMEDALWHGRQAAERAKG
jgi:protoporphyrinogen oxidase